MRAHFNFGPQAKFFKKLASPTVLILCLKVIEIISFFGTKKVLITLDFILIIDLCCCYYYYYFKYFYSDFLLVNSLYLLNLIFKHSYFLNSMFKFEFYFTAKADSRSEKIKNLFVN